MSIDDKNGEHELKAYLEGRDGVSAAYRQTPREEPPAALDRAILHAARKQAAPRVDNWYATRRPYALAASVMIAVAALSLYFGTLDDIALRPESAQQQVDATVVELQRAETREETQAQEEAAPPVPAAPAFDERQLAPPIPTVSVANNRSIAPAPARGAPVATDTLGVSVQAEAAALVIDGPLLEEIEADAAAAQAQLQGGAAGQLEEITVTGSRIVRRDEGDMSYRASRDSWLDEMRFMYAELERRASLVTARRSATLLEQQLDEEIELFLDAYPDTDIDAELEQ